MTKFIENGIHYGFKTFGAGLGKYLGKGKYEYVEHWAEIVKKAPKTYGRHTAHGARTVLKPFAFIPLGKFPTKKDAVWAAKEWLQMRFGGVK